MRNIKNFITFKTFYFPKIMQIVFFISTAIAITSSLVLVTKNWQLALPALIISPILLRLIFEFLIIPFKQYEALENINKTIQSNEK